MSETTVAVRRTDRGIPAAVSQALDDLGGARALFRPGEHVVLKPNLVAPRDAATGATTDLAILAALAEAIRGADAVPFWYETPGLEYHSRDIDSLLGIEDFLSGRGIERLDCSGGMARVKTPNGTHLRGVTVPKAAIEGALVSVAKMKTHAVTGVTLGIKNLMGLIAASDKRWMHVVGVNHALADLYGAVRPRLTVVDADVAMEGDGAVYGDARALGVLVAGDDALAVDLTCLTLMGLSLEDAPHLALARDRFGLSRVRLAGEPVEACDPPFALPRCGALYRAAYRMLYVGDLAFRPLFGRHLNEYLYSTGLVGTRPVIVRARCDACGECVRACPADAVDLDSKRIRVKRCLRCLRCFDACNRGAVRVRGMSRPGAPGSSSPTAARAAGRGAEGDRPGRAL